MNIPFCLNRFFSYEIRHKVKKLLRINTPILHRQLGVIDFTRGSNIILDIGANRGNFAINIFFQAPSAEVHCFEPNPDIFCDLQKNLLSLGTRRGKPRAIAIPRGVGSNLGQGELTLTKFDPASSFLPTTDVTKDGWKGVDFSESRKVVVPIIKLEDYAKEKHISAVKLMKIDVQGFELEVLKGAGQLLGNTEYIFVEVEFVSLYEGAASLSEIVRYLHENGFFPLSLGNFCLSSSGDLLQGDMLFINSSLVNR